MKHMCAERDDLIARREALADQSHFVADDVKLHRPERDDQFLLVEKPNARRGAVIEDGAYGHFENVRVFTLRQADCHGRADRSISRGTSQYVASLVGPRHWICGI